MYKGIEEKEDNLVSRQVITEPLQKGKDTFQGSLSSTLVDLGGGKQLPPPIKRKQENGWQTNGLQGGGLTKNDNVLMGLTNGGDDDDDDDDSHQTTPHHHYEL